MLIPVIYPHGGHDLVKGFYLDYLIKEEKIARFKRSDGWISIDAPNVRGRKLSGNYSGPERRLELLDNGLEKPEEIEFYPPA